VPDEEQAKAAVDGIPIFDTVLFGRRTYELFEKFWNRPVDDSSMAPDPHHAGQRTRQHREIAIWLNGITKLVFSKTLKDVKWKNARIINELDPREIDTMKSRPGRDMIIFGSGSIVSQLTQQGLIDEYQVVVCPVLLGNGRPLLTGVTKNSGLELVEARPYRSGDVMLRYARSR
jgi:dihydrofolate reductase